MSTAIKLYNTNDNNNKSLYSYKRADTIYEGCQDPPCHDDELVGYLAEVDLGGYRRF